MIKIRGSKWSSFQDIENTWKDQEIFQHFKNIINTVSQSTVSANSTEINALWNKLAEINALISLLKNWKLRNKFRFIYIINNAISFMCFV